MEFGLLYNYVRKEIEKPYLYAFITAFTKSNLFVIFFWVGCVDCGVKMGRIKLKAKLIVPKKIGSADPSFEITLREWNLGGKKEGAKKNKDYQVMDFI